MRPKGLRRRRGATSTEPADPGAGARAPEQAAQAKAAANDASPGSLAQELSRAAVNPTAWWNLLQSQFSQVAQAALAGAALADTVRNETPGRSVGGARSRKGAAAPDAPDAKMRPSDGARKASKAKPAKKRKASRSASKGRQASVATDGAGAGSRGTAGPAPRRAPAKRVRTKGQG